MNNYERAILKLRGFCDGAGGRSMDTVKYHYADYASGYADGQKAKSDYAKTSAQELGVIMATIKTQPAHFRAEQEYPRQDEEV